MAKALTIIIVNWNTRQMLKECLASVCAGIDLNRVELIVVDNASEDGSPQMVETEFGDAILVKNTENRGFAAANNQGLELATGRHVLLLNSDTIVHGDVLERSIGYLDAHPDVGAMGCRVLNPDGTVQITGSRFPTLVNLMLLTSGLWRLRWPVFFDRYQMRYWKREDECDLEVISGCYLMVKSEAVKQVGFLDESFFFFGEETDWCKRLGDAGWILRFAPVGEITHYGGGSVRKLNYRRDLMLASATVKLHRKHFGIVSAALVWCILLVFHITRAFVWMLIAAITHSEHARSRRDLFWNLTRNQHRMWPKGETVRI